MRKKTTKKHGKAVLSNVDWFFLFADDERVFKTSDEELSAACKLVFMETLIDAVNSCLVFKVIHKRVETEDVVCQRIVEACVIRCDKHIRCDNGAGECFPY